MEDPLEEKKNELMDILAYAYVRQISICHVEIEGDISKLMYTIGPLTWKKIVFMNVKTGACYRPRGNIRDEIMDELNKRKSINFSVNFLTDLNRYEEQQALKIIQQLTAGLL